MATRRELSPGEMRGELRGMLVRFDAFCRARGICYTMLAGTLLGAVRHGGFIPWDDDVDVGMPRPDLRKLIACKADFERETGLRLQGHLDVPLPVAPVVKVVNPRVVVEAWREAGERHLWMDISPFDGLPEDDAELGAFYAKLRFWQKVFGTLGSSVRGGKSAGRRRIIALAAPLRHSRLLKRAVAARLTHLAQSAPFGATAYVGSTSWGLSGVRERVHYRQFAQMVDLPFEGHQLLAMGCWEEYLVNTYAETYMTPWRPSSQPPHITRAWLVEGDAR